MPPVLIDRPAFLAVYGLGQSFFPALIKLLEPAKKLYPSPSRLSVGVRNTSPAAKIYKFS